MSRRRGSLAFAVGAVTALVVVGGCADTDPNYGPPDAIRGRTIDFGTGAADPTPTDAGGATTKTARELFEDLHTTFAGGSGTCLPCHTTGGSGVTLFAVPDSNASYALFKQKSYPILTTPNAFYTKGQHTGPPLTAAQKTLTQQWAAAEAAGGGGTTTTPPADAGGGG